MYKNPQYRELQPEEETRLVSRITLLVIYLFLGSLLSLIAVSSVFASDGRDIASARYDRNSDSRTGYTGSD